MSLPNNNIENQNEDYLYDSNIEAFTQAIDASSIFTQYNETPVFELISPALYNNSNNFFNMIYTMNPYLIEEINNYIGEEFERILEDSFLEQQPEPTPKSPIKFLILPYDSIKDKTEDKECAICLSDLDEKTPISITKCSHLFHNNCISEWSTHKIDCPICRTNMI
jgi:hypothetical protein